MLEFVRGEVLRVGNGGAVIALGNVGVRIDMPTPDLAGLDGEVTVHTVLLIKDENPVLFGFATERGRELFRALTTVNGVGPKLALAILSFHPSQALERAIASGDADVLSLVPGVGKKTAQRIALELKDKLGVGGDQELGSDALAEVREALKGLGYTPQEVQGALAALPSDGDAPTLLRHALRTLGSQETAGAAR